MTDPCPLCHSSHTKVIKTEQCTNGTRRRRRICWECGHRWSHWYGSRPTHRGGSTAKRGRRITPEEVELMLTNQTLTHSELARRLQLHKGTVRNVRIGKILTHIKPELPRWEVSHRPTRTCDQCSHWQRGACDYGFSDPVVEGITFAADCDLFQNRRSADATSDLLYLPSNDTIRP